MSHIDALIATTSDAINEADLFSENVTLRWGAHYFLTWRETLLVILDRGCFWRRFGYDNGNVRTMYKW